YHYHGIRHLRQHYIKQFLGPVWYLAPLMLVIEIISHFARILSLTVRLYANMFAGDLVTLAFFSLVPFLVPVLFLALHFGVAIIQTFIFVMLTIVYLGMAVSEEHLALSPGRQREGAGTVASTSYWRQIHEAD